MAKNPRFKGLAVLRQMPAKIYDFHMRGGLKSRLRGERTVAADTQENAVRRLDWFSPQNNRMRDAAARATGTDVPAWVPGRDPVPAAGTTVARAEGFKGRGTKRQKPRIVRTQKELQEGLQHQLPPEP